MENLTKLFSKYIHRDGASDLLEWLKTTDFFTAPASTRFHGDHEGGLCEHSVFVFKHLANLSQCYRRVLGIASWEEKSETIAITALLHDLCKIGLYKIDFRNQKDENGKWKKVPFYTSKEDDPCGGHGFKSVFVIEDYMKLTREEQVAIANHMGAYDRMPTDFTHGTAFERYPLAFLLHTADCAATYFDEKKQ